MLSPLHDWLLKWGMSEAGATLLTRLGGVLLVLFVALIANRVSQECRGSRYRAARAVDDLELG